MWTLTPGVFVANSIPGVSMLIVVQDQSLNWISYYNGVICVSALQEEGELNLGCDGILYAGCWQGFSSYGDLSSIRDQERWSEAIHRQPSVLISHLDCGVHELAESSTSSQQAPPQACPTRYGYQSFDICWSGDTRPVLRLSSELELHGWGQ